jgi:DNA-binding LytR/AlgR family response regulator
MNILIIEDELLAQAKLEAMLLKLDPALKVLAKLGSVKDSISWLTTHPTPDVAFVDIQLSDDHSFEIFKKIPIQFPVIFTTAYDKYLLDSFEFNAIDYLLKPITAERLKRSLAKLKTFEHHFIQGNLDRLINKEAQPPTYQRIVVKKGTEFIALDVNDIAYFFTEHRIVFVKDHHGRQFITDKTLSEFEAGLDKKQFFRINRKFIASLRAIEKFKPDNGKVKISLTPPLKEDVHVSKEAAPEFRKWIGAD